MEIQILSMTKRPSLIVMAPFVFPVWALLVIVQQDLLLLLAVMTLTPAPPVMNKPFLPEMEAFVSLVQEYLKIALPAVMSQ